MAYHSIRWFAFTASVFIAFHAASAQTRNAEIEVSGELKTWHKVTLTLHGPQADETMSEPNPFTDFRFDVLFEHESGTPRYVVPGYFAADGRAAESSATSGNCWRAHLSPDKPGRWRYRTAFVRGPLAAVEADRGEVIPQYDGLEGTFTVVATDKVAPDFRAPGRLQYVGQRYLRFAGSGEYFLKAGADAPETLLAYADFDGTEPGRRRAARAGEAMPTQALKTWTPHLQDWKPGDPSWQSGRGKGLIGALNYLSSKGVNAFSFLTYNAGGDGDNVWPFVARDDKLHYDCSKLDQWGIVFDHATTRGLYLHFKLQENEIDDDRRGERREVAAIPEALDGGKLGPQRKLYLRELVARYAHHLALNWNLGEENTQSAEEIREMAHYLRALDPYDHPIVLHTFPNQQDEVYSRYLGEATLSGLSLQNSWRQVHALTRRWVDASKKAGHAWVVANDEQNPAGLGVPPDPGYAGHSGVAMEGKRAYTLDDIRKWTLWGNLMAGGAGVEYYFGYQLPQNDLVCEDFRSRDRSWDYCRFALDFFQQRSVPFWEMASADDWLRDNDNAEIGFCFSGEADHTRTIVVYRLGGSGDAVLRPEAIKGVKSLSAEWYDPRTGAWHAVEGLNLPANEPLHLPQPPEATDQDWTLLMRLTLE